MELQPYRSIAFAQTGFGFGPCFLVSLFSSDERVTFPNLDWDQISFKPMKMRDTRTFLILSVLLEAVIASKPDTVAFAPSPIMLGQVKMQAGN